MRKKKYSVQHINHTVKSVKEIRSLNLTEGVESAKGYVLHHIKVDLPKNTSAIDGVIKELFNSKKVKRRFPNGGFSQVHFMLFEFSTKDLDLLKEAAEWQVFVNNKVKEIESVDKLVVRTNFYKEGEKHRFNGVLQEVTQVGLSTLIENHFDYDDYFLDGFHDDFRPMLSTDVDFQRDRVWNDEQKENLIRSMLLGIPIGAIYINRCDVWDGQKLKYPELDNIIYDGKQRFTTILDFIDGLFSVEIDGVNYFYDDLNFHEQKSLYDMTIPVVRTYFENKKDLIKFYLQLNTGGTHHSQEDIQKAKTILAELD